MTFNEALVVIGGLGVGYFVVSRLLGDSREEQPIRESGSAPVEEPVAGSDTPQSLDAQHISNNWYLILEVSLHPTREELVEAYRRRLRAYEPAVMAALSAEQRERAELGRQQVDAAYEYAIRWVR